MTASVNHVRRLDHVNIRSDRVRDSVNFYEGLLGLSAVIPPGMPPGIEVTWLCDSGGLPIIHITRPFPGEKMLPDEHTGQLHHVAFDCHGHDAIICRLNDMALRYELNAVPSVGLRQIFVIDPNGVRLEMNFTSD
ncbi:MAG: VOC family protein [Sphingobium sp.]